MVIERLFWLDLQVKVPRAFNIALCFFLIMMGFVIFRADTIPQSIDYFGALFAPAAGIPRAVAATPELMTYIAIGLFLSFFPACRLYEEGVRRFEALRFRDELATFGAIVLFVLSIGRIAGASFSPFLYFRF
jgi:alginate O-acetyltransferase complex protein AlgI